VIGFNTAAENTNSYLNGRGSERRRSEHRKVRTSKFFFKMIRTSKDQNVERSERRKSERRKERRKSKNDFRRSDLS